MNGQLAGNSHSLKPPIYGHRLALLCIYGCRHDIYGLLDDIYGRPVYSWILCDCKAASRWDRTCYTAHQQPLYTQTHTHTCTHQFNGPLSGTTRVSQYQKGRTNMKQETVSGSGHMQVCISLQTDNHASTPPLSFFYRTDALPAAQPTASKHRIIRTVIV